MAHPLITAQAWNNTKEESDLEFGDSAKSAFWRALQIDANRVVETGVARNSFEREVLRLHEEGKSEKGK